MQRTITSSNTPVDIERAIETDLHAHLTDTVNAIRGGQLVAVSWEDLRPEERRAANLNTFRICEWEV